ncbi:hypothetical protein GF361_02560 [Candidatus Woesearchaeota archaeon]|nr:hypothetical protein [Candidatus Woesearchaeota archaeon]
MPDPFKDTRALEFILESDCEIRFKSKVKDPSLILFPTTDDKVHYLCPGEENTMLVCGRLKEKRSVYKLAAEIIQEKDEDGPYIYFVINVQNQQMQYWIRPLHSQLKTVKGYPFTEVEFDPCYRQDFYTKRNTAAKKMESMKVLSLRNPNIT